MSSPLQVTILCTRSRPFAWRLALLAITFAGALAPSLAAQESAGQTASPQPTRRAPRFDALTAEGYIRPPEPIAHLVDAPRNLNVTLTTPSPTKQYFIIPRSDGMPALSDFGKPYYNLAGIQIDPAGERIRSITTHPLIGIDLFDWTTGRTIAIELPTGARAASPTWSPDGKSVAYFALFDSATQVYVADAETGKSRPVTRTSVLATSDTTLRWTADSKSIIAVLLPANRGPEPLAPMVASEPLVRTHEDTETIKTPTFRPWSLLQSSHDEALLEYYMTGQVAIIDVATRTEKRIGAPAMIRSLDASPDGTGFRVTLLERPFSYFVQAGSFGTVDQLWDADGKTVLRIAEHPLDEDIDRVPPPQPSDPILANPAMYPSAAPPGDHDATGGRSGGSARLPAADTGKRFLAWNPAGAGMIYLQLEPLPPQVRPGAVQSDSGRHDRVMQWLPPFSTTSAKPLYASEGRLINPRLSGDGSILFVTETLNGRTTETAVFLKQGGQRYAVIGGAVRGRGRGGSGAIAPIGRTDFVMTPGPRGLPVVMVSTDGRYVFTRGAGSPGSPPSGGRAAGGMPATGPYVDRIEIKTGVRERMYQGQDTAFTETISAPLDDDYSKAIVQRGSATVYPQSFVRDLKTGAITQVTRNTDPTPDMEGVVRKTVTARRADGYSFQVRVTLPPGYKTGTRLPALFWFYPREYENQEAYDNGTELAGSSGANTYPSFGPRSMAFLTLVGYALVEPNAPIFARDGLQPNDSYVDDLRNDLAATIDALDTLGMIDRQRLAIGGHSYGGFSTVNAMVHTQFFKAGIAGDGSYNRTLTPNGFQNEQRDIWQATQTYLDMSPFLYANRLTGALLMYHSLDDQNVGTDPINSTRLFQALQGLGKTTALYMYPYEDHSPATRETNLDQWARWVAWLDKYVKNAGKTEPLAADEEAPAASR